VFTLNRNECSRWAGICTRIENGNFGDFKQLCGNLFELRFFFTGDLRIYYAIQQEKVILLLNGGDKSSQKNDLAKATQILDRLE